MPGKHYLFYKSLTERAFSIDGPYTSKEECERRVVNLGAAEYIALYKEFPDTLNSAELNLAAVAFRDAQSLATRGLGDILVNDALWRNAGTNVSAPDWGIPRTWDALPAIGTYHGGYVNRTRNYFRNITFTNPGEALRYAAERVASLPRDPSGYVAYPRIALNPAQTWFLPMPIPELIGEIAPGTHATIKDMADTTLPSPTCGKCGFMGHRKSECVREEKAHDRVGVEVEGRWLDLPSMKTKAAEITGSVGTGDGSVYRDAQMGADPWEFQTKPANVKGAIEQTLALYPDSVDHKCGMHVHISFNATDIGFFTHPEFFAYFRARWLKWGEANNLHPQSEFYTRLNGGNSFCMPNKPAGRDPTNMDRYAQLNFAAWNEHKTVECRLLPMFRRQSLAVSAINELIAIFEDYLVQDDLTDRLYAQEVVMPVPVTAPWKETKEFVVPDFTASKFTYDIHINELPPVRKGERRVAIPTGRVLGTSTNWSAMLLAKQGKAE